MKMRIVVLLVGITSAALSVGGQEPPRRLTSIEAKDHVGETATVCGRVVTFRCNPGDHITYLDLDNPYWTRPFSVAITKADRAKFGTRLEDRYRSQRVCVAGTIQDYELGRRIVARDPDQLSMPEGPIASPTPSTMPVYRFCDDGVELPRPIQQPGPRYTSAAMSEKKQGKVLLQGVVSAEGTVREVEVVYSLDRLYGLDDEAIMAFKQWRFRPGTYLGQPVDIAVTVEMSFTLGGP
jgi:TonB family protein